MSRPTIPLSRSSTPPAAAGGRRYRRHPAVPRVGRLPADRRVAVWTAADGARHAAGLRPRHGHAVGPPASPTVRASVRPLTVPPATVTTTVTAPPPPPAGSGLRCPDDQRLHPRIRLAHREPGVHDARLGARHLSRDAGDVEGIRGARVEAAQTARSSRAVRPLGRRGARRHRRFRVVRDRDQHPGEPYLTWGGEPNEFGKEFRSWYEPGRDKVVVPEKGIQLPVLPYTAGSRPRDVPLHDGDHRRDVHRHQDRTRFQPRPRESWR